MCGKSSCLLEKTSYIWTDLNSICRMHSLVDITTERMSSYSIKFIFYNIFVIHGLEGVDGFLFEVSALVLD